MYHITVSGETGDSCEREEYDGIQEDRRRHKKMDRAFSLPISDKD